ncbi:DnaJ-domain-containing protein [Daldinia decipiens]|uniref:DnaJ-domain-containing protein n=1 Tax=Daldinia decipiens TaxID=326647 RepID=UPI0020C2D48C|nr:DnaJ-domain-containing protein [Daldinia decipiens]KAI1661073.1 DnaJ-domain-containing protein [Daldinia decipiens]
MAPSAVTDDYYAVLGVARTADAETLKVAWRRLARIKHPDKNLGNPNATAEFQLLESAYSTLCNPTLRRAYDLQSMTTPTSNGSTTGAKCHNNTSTTSNDSSEQKNRERELKRSHLYKEKQSKEYDIFEAMRNLNRIRGEIQKLDEDAKRDTAEELSWWGYFSFMMPGSQQQREEKSRERDRRRLDRIAAKRIKEKELKRQTDKVTLLELLSKGTQDEIDKITLEINKWKEEKAAAWRREAQRQQEEYARREKARREEEEAEAVRRASEWEAWRRKVEETSRLFQERQRTQRKKDEAASCTHRGWWKKVDGPHLCSNCSTRTNRFALQCPQCGKTACASCRKAIQAAGQTDKIPRPKVETSYETWYD